ncbi:MAG TPA: prepilin peptidase [Acidimicrobiales bacterium]|nr:prepilin peptidase [Acidimicrobiales bacterium]
MIADVVAALFGLVVGSFLTVVTARVPEGESVVAPSSRCPACGVPIRPLDNVPLVSYALRRGRCRACGTHISLRYPATELATAALFTAVTARAPTLWAAPAYCVLVAGLVALSVVDLERFRLPTPIIVATGVVGLPLLLLPAVADHDLSSLVRVPVAGAVGFALLGVVFVAAPRGMGFGDVRLAGLCGAFLGWLGYRVVAVGLVLGFVSAGAVAVVLLALGRAGRKTRLPFGPFLALGTVVAVLFGPDLARAWLG